MSYKVSTPRAQDVVDFIQRHMLVPEGKDVGKPVRLRDWQLKFIDGIYSTPTRLAILSMGRKKSMGGGEETMLQRVCDALAELARPGPSAAS